MQIDAVYSSCEFLFRPKRVCNIWNGRRSILICAAAGCLPNAPKPVWKPAASLTSYPCGDASGNSSLSIGPFTDWQITQAIHVTLPRRTCRLPVRFAGVGQASTLVSYYAELQVSHQLTDYFSHQLSLQAQCQPGPQSRGNSLEEFTAGILRIGMPSRQPSAAVSAAPISTESEFSESDTHGSGVGVVLDPNGDLRPLWRRTPPFRGRCEETLGVLSYNHYLGNPICRPGLLGEYPVIQR